MKKRNVDVKFFPGWVRKSVTFTIDDGNVPMDRKFLDIVRPAGILGTFNLCSHNLGYLTESGYRELYHGYGIANHGKYHAVSLPENVDYPLSEEPFDRVSSDDMKMYRHPFHNGAYMCHFNMRYPELPRKEKPQGWATAVPVDVYCELAQTCQKELRALFGDRAARGYVYPGGKENALPAVDAVRALGYFYVRKTGAIADSTKFSMPADRGEWTYNATHSNLLEVMEKYEKYPDDGELKFFSFGVHSVDYEHADKWGDLESFARIYGNRPDTYYYASVEDIFDYEDAVSALTVTDTEIVNTSDVDVYVKVDRKPLIVKAKSTLEI